jgi:UDP-glucose 4-epimerase
VKVVVTGATGNAGTSVVETLAKNPDVDEIVGLARRCPRVEIGKTRWVAADVSYSDLTPLFRGSDVVIHLAWLIQPSHDERKLIATNIEGSRRTFAAVAEAGVRNLVYASSVGAYSAGPKNEAVDEGWPTSGVQSSFYGRHKARVERLLDSFETEHPEIRSVRLRPGLIFKAQAASGIRRLFAGPLLPNRLVRPSLIPLIPRVKGLRFQAVHSYDVGDAYMRAATSEVRGAFNIAADPVLDSNRLG